MGPGESLSEACAREVLEEMGLRVHVGQLVTVYTDPNVLLEYADGNRLQLVVLHFSAKIIGGAMARSDVTMEVALFSREEAEELDMGGFDRQRVRDGFDRQVAASAYVREGLACLW